LARKALISHEVIIQLIQATKTKKGLSVRSALDTGQYPTGRRFSPKDIADLNLVRHEFHGEWNYTFCPSFLS
jgi:hypothetical protein